MNLRKNSAITLIALVITIIVLLILAGVSLNLVAGGDGILKRAENAVKETNEAQIDEEVELAMAQLKTEYFEEKYVNKNDVEPTFGEYVSAKFTEKDNSGKLVGIPTANGKVVLDGNTVKYIPEGKDTETATGTFDKTTGDITISQTPTGGNNGTTAAIPEGLEVGSEVSYTPSGTYNEWTTDHSGYSTSYKLASGSLYNKDDATLTDMTISSWKVFKIDEKTGEVTLVPSQPTGNTVGLKGADGYNNAVKLLNDACSSLYGNGNTIKARSISIKDIEDKDVLDYDPTTYVNTIDSDESVNYGQHKNSAYDETNQIYPSIYAEEIDSVITPVPEEKNKSLGLSDSASDWVTGTVDTATSIHPKQTYYKLSFDNFSSKLKGDYSELLLPSEKNTNYWLASRSVLLYTDFAAFFVSIVVSGDLSGNDMCLSRSDGRASDVRSLFPVVTLNVNQISGNAEAGWSIK